MRHPIIAILALAVVTSDAAGQSTRTFIGAITDSECSNADHSRMRMGPTDPECVRACIEDHNASYVLYDGKNSYTLSDQKAPEPFAGKRVVVTGTLDAKTKTIRVSKIEERRR